MRRCFALLSLLLLAACEPEGSGACAVEESTYSVTAQVALSEQLGESKTLNAAEPRVLASIYQSSSIVGCGNGLATEVSPGHALVDTRQVSVDAAGFTLRFTESSYPELDLPALDLEVLLDENGNGHCDDGEPSARIPLERAQHARVQIELIQSPCRTRL